MIYTNIVLTTIAVLLFCVFAGTVETNDNLGHIFGQLDDIKRLLKELIKKEDQRR